MFKNRGFLIVILVLAGLMIYWLLTRNGTSLNLLRRQAEELPLDLQEVIPDEWKIEPGQSKKCSFDTDSDAEWLIVFRYDTTKVSSLADTAALEITRGPIGAAIFDTQPPQLEEAGNPSPYRPNLVIPYRLLPDIYPKKGQGYLGESQVKPIFYPPITSGEECQVEEITFLGYSDSPLPTRLSIFRWQGRAVGYGTAHFAGTARIDTRDPIDGSKLVRQVTTYDRMQNHRSLLCESRTYGRVGDTLEFKEDPLAFTLDFCYQAPPDPTYPEGVVVALLRGQKPLTRFEKKLGTPTTSFMLNNAPLPSEIEGRIANKIQIWAVVNSGGVIPRPGGGRDCTGEEADLSKLKWTCGRESAEVKTEIVLDGQIREAVWQLISIVPDQVDSDVYWRVQSVTLP